MQPESISGMHLACCHGNIEEVRRLIVSGEDVNWIASDGLSPLHRVAIELDDSEASQEIVSMLIEAGADLNGRCRLTQLTPLQRAITHGRLGMAEQLMKAFADLDVIDSMSESPLCLAVRYGYTEMAAKLISAGASADLASAKGFAPLHSAIENGRQDILQILIRSIANVDIAGDLRITPLHLAVFYGREAMLDQLIEAQANVNLKCTPAVLSATPLLIATGLKRKNLVRKLIDAGADVNGPEGSLLSVLYVAVLTGDRAICEILLESGATVDPADPMLRLFLTLANKKGFKDALDLFSVRGVHTAESSSHVEFNDSTPVQAQDTGDEAAFSESLSEAMHKAGFNSVNATIQSGAAALMQDFARQIQGHNRMFLFGSYSDGWGSCLTGIDGRVDDDSDIDCTFVDCGHDMCIQQFCQRPKCQFIKAQYNEGYILHCMDASNPNASIPSILSNTVIDFIIAHMCCCYPTIRLLQDKYQTNISPHILETLKQEVFSTESQCHVVSADSPRLPRGHSMRVSTTVLEKILMHSLLTVQGQLFILVKFLIKKVMSKTVKGLKTYVAKNLLFYMLDRTPAADWQARNLIDLVRRALRMLTQMMSECDSDDVCMSHFFLRDAAVYLRKDHSTKQEIQDCIRNVINKLPELLTELTKNLKTADSGIISFHPFVQIFLWSRLSSRSYSSADGTLGYDQLYDSVKLIIQKLNDPVSVNSRSEQLQDLLRRIREIPKCARTARECLEAMAHIKMGEKLEDAVRCISDRRVHTVSRGIKCPSGDSTELSVADAKEFVRNHLETEDSAWKFAFILGFDHKPDFGFLPDSLKPVLSAIWQFGYWHLNFDALASALRQNSPLPVIQDLLLEFGDDVFKAALALASSSWSR